MGVCGHAYNKEYFANQCLSAGDSIIPYKFLRLLRHLPSHHLPHRALSRLNPGSTLQLTLAILHSPRPHPSQQLPIPPHRRLRPGLLRTARRQNLHLRYLSHLNLHPVRRRQPRRPHVRPVQERYTGGRCFCGVEDEERREGLPEMRMHDSGVGGVSSYEL